MKLSTKCRYGARAIIEIAKNYRDKPVKRKIIVKNQDISDSYLENILISLKNSGIVGSIRGTNGGYVLRRSPSEITFLEIVNALEGSISPVECVNNPSVCTRVDICSTRGVWKSLNQVQEKLLSSITIQELIDKEKKGETD